MSFTEFGLSSAENSSHREAPNKHNIGNKRYSEKVSRGSKEAEKKNLPFTFSKPQRDLPRCIVCCCTECGSYTRVTKNTVMVICSVCKNLFSVTEENKQKE